MLSEVSNVPPANACKTSSDLVISSRNLLTKPDNLVQSRRGNTAVDSRKTKGKAIADFRVESTGRSEAVLASAGNSKASSNVGGQTATLTATCSSDHHLDAEHSKYDTGDKITRQTRLSKSKKLEITNSVALPYEDKMCNNDFNVKGDLVRHTKTHDTKCSFQCNECGYECFRASLLERHERTHTGERPFLCDVCGKGFAQKGNLTVHKRIHACEYPFKCDECDYECVSTNSLNRHKKIHTGERPFRCDICEKTFSQKGNLTEHKRTHTGERPFQCEVCDKRFIQKYNLTVHKRTHTDERPFQCEVCDKKFTQNYNLTVHKRIHTGKCPFRCDVCEKTFTQKSNLTVHKRIHTNERPFQCDICNKKFTQKVNLTEHKKIHTDERPFKGTECGKSFIKKSHLDSHAFSHISLPPFKCDACDASFRQKSTLKRHVCTHNEKQPYKANRKSRKISNKRRTTDRNPVQPGPDHNNEKSFKSSHCDANFTSTTSNQHTKPKTHTTNSETGLTTPDDVSTITQLPSVSNQLSTNGIQINNQKKYEEYSEYAQTVALLNEFADTYPITLNPVPCEHHDNLFLDQEML